jgi:phosphoglycolate phosphatase
MKGACGVLENLNKQGITQVIVSASAQKELLTFIMRFGVESYFSTVLGAEDYYAESKLQRAVSFLTENKIAPQNVVVIGDTLHDHETAEALKSECFLISNGHQCKDDLLKSGSIVLDDISEVNLYI